MTAEGAKRAHDRIAILGCMVVFAMGYCLWQLDPWLMGAFATWALVGRIDARLKALEELRMQALRRNPSLN